MVITSGIIRHAPNGKSLVLNGRTLELRQSTRYSVVRKKEIKGHVWTSANMSSKMVFKHDVIKNFMLFFILQELALPPPYNMEICCLTITLLSFSFHSITHYVLLSGLPLVIEAALLICHQNVIFSHVEVINLISSHVWEENWEINQWRWSFSPVPIHCPFLARLDFLSLLHFSPKHWSLINYPLYLSFAIFLLQVEY